MTYKERLEEIKNHFAYCMDEGLLFAEQEEKLLEELYKQAERVDELEVDLSYYKMSTEHYEYMEQQNKRYSKALEDALRYVNSRYFEANVCSYLKPIFEEALEETE